MTLEPSHAQRIDHQATFHPLIHRPSHDLTAEQIDNDGQK